MAVAEPRDAAALVRVELHSMPAGATILVDGKPRGRTPATVEVPVGTELELRRGGYRVAHVRATAAGPLDVQLVLVPPKKPAKKPAKPCPMPPCEGLD